MKYYAVFLKVNDTEIAKKHHEEHIDYVQQLCREKKIQLIGKLVGEGGLIIFQADSMKTVESWLAKDPFIIHGARTYELYEWHMKSAAEYVL